MLNELVLTSRPHTWIDRRVARVLFGGQQHRRSLAPVDGVDEALRRAAPGGWTRRGPPLYPRARKGGSAGGPDDELLRGVCF